MRDGRGTELTVIYNVETRLYNQNEQYDMLVRSSIFEQVVNAISQFSYRHQYTKSEIYFDTEIM